MSGAESETSIGRTLGKKFLVRREIGRGGMGVVYEVEHVVTKRIGALKLLHRSFISQPSVVERFLREASAAGRIGNPHIVETLDAGELPTGEPYMFMELLTGNPVRELIAERGRLSFGEARELVLQAAEGLAAAHAAGIVHRDIKPENLFLCRGERAYVKLIDFGISKFELNADHRLTTEGAPMGTPYYMSPEQVAGKADVDARSDVYSLGVVLYECVTGKVPFDAASLPALSLKIFEGKYASPSRLFDAAPAGFDELMARAMAVPPSQRYQSMREFHDALAGLGTDAPMSLAPTLVAAEHSGTRAGKPRRVLVLAGVGVFAAAAVALGSRGSPEREAAADAGVSLVEASAIPALPIATLASAVAPAPAMPSASAPLVPSSAAPSARPSGRSPRAVGSVPTRAARDGLTETNPFDP